jgi:hypothetical protein
MKVDNQWSQRQVVPKSLLCIEVVIIPLVTAGWGLMLQSMWFDELFSLVDSRSGFWQNILINLKFRTVPLYPILHWVVTLGGVSLLGGRLLSLLGFMASAYFIVRLSARLFDSRTALWAGAAFVLNPLAVWYAQDARMYTVWLFLCFASLFFQIEAMSYGRRADLLCFGIVFLLGLLTHLYFLFFAVVCFLWLLWYRTTQHRRKVFAAMAVTFAIALPVTATMMFLSRQGPPPSQPFGRVGFEALGYPALTFGVGFGFGPTVAELHSENPMRVMMPYLFPAIALIAAFWLPVLYGFWQLWRNDRRTACLLLLSVGLPITAAFAAARISGYINFNVRYVLPALPFALIAFGYGVSRATSRARWVAVLLLFLVEGYGLASHYTQTRYWKEDYRGVSRFLREQAKSEDEIFFTPYPAELSILLDDRPVRLLNPTTFADSKAMPQRRFYVINSPWIGDPNGQIRRELHEGLSATEIQFRGFQVYILPEQGGRFPQTLLSHYLPDSELPAIQDCVAYGVHVRVNRLFDAWKSASLGTKRAGDPMT